MTAKQVGCLLKGLGVGDISNEKSLKYVAYSLQYSILNKDIRLYYVIITNLFIYTVYLQSKYITT